MASHLQQLWFDLHSNFWDLFWLCVGFGSAALQINAISHDAIIVAAHRGKADVMDVFKVWYGRVFPITVIISMFIVSSLATMYLSGSYDFSYVTLTVIAVGIPTVMLSWIAKKKFEKDSEFPQLLMDRYAVHLLMMSGFTESTALLTGRMVRALFTLIVLSITFFYYSFR